MLLNYKKELTPHLFNSNGLKIMHSKFVTPNEQAFAPHWHSHMEFLYITSGTLVLILGEAQSEVHQGDFVIISPNILHSGLVGGDGVAYIAITLDPSNFLSNIPIMQKRLVPIIENKVSFIPYTNNREVIAVVEDLLNPQYDNAENMMQLVKTYELFEMLYQHCVEQHVSLIKNNAKIDFICEYMNKHFCENISTKSLSKKFGYSEEHFCRIFKAETGLTPMAYIRRLRLEKATSMLSSDKRSINIIAQECGFNSVQYFTRSFKSNYKLTPSEYIKKHEQKKHNSQK